MASSREDSTPRAEPGDTGLVPLTAEWVHAIGERFGASAKLVMAETRLAVSSFLVMIFLVIPPAGAALFGWGLLLLALAQALSVVGMNLAAAVGMMSMLHLVLAWLLWNYANRVGQYLEFRNTRRLLGS